MQRREAFRLAAAGAVVVLLAGCASSAKIRSDYDRSADFSQYRTWNFFEDAGPSGSEYQSFFSRYVRAAIEREMSARGYEKSDDPDLLVNFNARLEDKTRVSTTPAPPPMYGGYYGYRRGFYDPWFDYGYGTETHVSQYTEGTFNIDIVDADEKKLIWEAVGIGRVNESTYENLEERVNEAVPKFFSTFPGRAGVAVD